MLRLLFYALLGGIAAALLGQLTAPYHLLTHEFTQVFTLACGAGVFVLPRLLHGAPEQRLLLTMAIAGVLGASTFTTQQLINLTWYDCRPAGTGMFFWLTWPPTALMASVLGVLSTDWSARKTRCFMLLLIVLDGLNLGLQSMVGARMVDVFVGDLIGFSQRIEMVTSSTHILQRLWLTGAALLIWVLHRRADRLLTALIAVPFLATTVLAGSAVGLGSGRDMLHASLDGELHTEHFAFRYQGNGQAKLYLDVIATNAEWEWHRLQRAFALDPDTRIEVRLFEDYAHLTALTSQTSAHAGPHWMNLPWWSALKETFAHELVHTVHLDLTWNPALALLRGHTEGLASAWEDDLLAIPQAHTVAAGALRSGQLPSASVVMSVGGFTKVNESNAYDASASFVGWLILEQGIADYVRLQRTLNYSGIYGRDLDTLDADWRTFLQQLPVDLQAQSMARERFDPVRSPAYQSQQCPKLSARTESREELADRRYYAGDYSRAYQDYAAILAAEDTLHTALQAASCLQQLSAHERALELLDRPLHGLADDERDQLLAARSVSQLHTADLTALRQTLAARDALEPSRDRAILADCLADADIGAALGTILAQDDELRLQRDLQALVDQYPEHAGLQHLLATRGVTLSVSRYSLSLPPEQRQQLSSDLERIAQAPEICELLAGDLLALVPGLMRTDARDLTLAVLGILERCADPHVALQTERYREQLEWEAQR